MILDKNGKRIGRAGAKDRIPVGIDEVPDHFVAALVAAEDHRYFSHPGFDIQGIARAVIENYQNQKISEGASTLTQQLARNTFELKERSYERKLTEIALAWRVERRFSKEEILEHYLNLIYFGSGSHGVGAAANNYFGKSVEELTIGESAMLCGIIRSPSRLSPKINFEAAVKSRDRTIDRMYSLNLLTSKERDEWKASETKLGTPAQKGQMRYLALRVQEEARKILGDRPFNRLTIQTSIDLDLQAKATNSLRAQLEKLEREGKAAENSLQGAVFVIENKTGFIHTAVGSRDFAKSEFDRIWGLKRPTGSAFIPFVYGTAFDSGKLAPTERVLDAPVDNKTVMLGGTSGILGEWSTENPDNHWEGAIPAVRALATSKNSAAIRVGNAVGLKTVNDQMKKAGVTSPPRDFASALLGASEIKLPEITRAYTAFANQGVLAPEGHFVRQIIDGENEIVYDSKATAATEPDRVFTAKTAATVASLLKLDGEAGNVVTAGKSGTTSDYTDSWFVGFNSQYSWGVWVGTDEFKTIFPEATGTTGARPVWEALKPELETGTALPQPDGMTWMQIPGPEPLQALVGVEDAALLASNTITPPTTATTDESEEGKNQEEEEDKPPTPFIPALIGPDPYGALNPELPHDRYRSGKRFTRISSFAN